MAATAAINPTHIATAPKGSRLSAGALIGPATLIVLLGLIIPLLILLRYSLNTYDPRQLMIETVSAQNYVRFIADPYYRKVLLTTLRVAFFCTLACLVFGFPLAFVLARTRSRFKNVLILLTVLPLFVGNAVRSAGWMTLLGSKGMFNSTLLALGLVRQPVDIMYTEVAVILGLISINMPFMVLTLQGVIEGIDRTIDEAALSLGAGPWQAFWRIIWPLALPGIVTGTTLAFILAMNAYATPVLLGGPQFKTMAPLVYEQFQLGNWPFGAAAAFILMATTLILTIASTIWMRRTQNY